MQAQQNREKIKTAGNQALRAVFQFSDMPQAQICFRAKHTLGLSDSEIACVFERPFECPADNLYEIVQLMGPSARAEAERAFLCIQLSARLKPRWPYLAYVYERMRMAFYEHKRAAVVGLISVVASSMVVRDEMLQVLLSVALVLIASAVVSVCNHIETLRK